MAGRDRRRGDRRGNNVTVSVNRRAEQRRTRERRANQRVPLELWMEEMAGEDVYFRRTGNVSPGGVFFDRAIPHSLGTIVTLKFAIPGDKEMVVARGEVVSSAEATDGLGMGVKFISFEGDGKKRIRQALRAGG